MIMMGSRNCIGQLCSVLVIFVSATIIESQAKSLEPDLAQVRRYVISQLHYQFKDYPKPAACENFYRTLLEKLFTEASESEIYDSLVHGGKVFTEMSQIQPKSKPARSRKIISFLEECAQLFGDHYTPQTSYGNDKPATHPPETYMQTGQDKQSNSNEHIKPVELELKRSNEDHENVEKDNNQAHADVDVARQSVAANNQLREQLEDLKKNYNQAKIDLENARRIVVEKQESDKQLEKLRRDLEQSRSDLEVARQRIVEKDQLVQQLDGLKKNYDQAKIDLENARRIVVEKQESDKQLEKLRQDLERASVDLQGAKQTAAMNQKTKEQLKKLTREFEQMKFDLTVAKDMAKEKEISHKAAKDEVTSLITERDKLRSFITENLYWNPNKLG